MKSSVTVVISFCLALALAWATGQAGQVVANWPVMVWLVLFAFAVQWLVFFHSWRAQTDRFFDATGSATYILGTMLALLLVDHLAPRGWLLAAMVILWAGRLGTFLFLRTRRSGGDSRFAEILPNPLRLFSVWTIQGLWVSVTALAAWTGITAAADAPLGWLTWLGCGVWALGWGLELVADAQKSRFRRDPANRGEFIRSGVWRWSRHPNYFGEIVLWTGVSLVAIPVLRGWQWLAVSSPLFVTLLLTQVSGIPLLEKQADQRWGGRSDYQDYKARTSVLVPWPPRR